MKNLVTKRRNIVHDLIPDVKKPHLRALLEINGEIVPKSWTKDQLVEKVNNVYGFNVIRKREGTWDIYEYDLMHFLKVLNDIWDYYLMLGAEEAAEKFEVQCAEEND